MRRAIGRRFAADENGVAAIEFSVVVPILIVVVLGAATYFVMGREDYRSKRATYVAADIIARQNSVSDSYLALVKTLAERIATSNARTIGFRVTSATKIGPLFVVNWSYATAPYAKRTLIDSALVSTPLAGIGESILMVETSTPYRPLFGLAGLAQATHENVSFARPRNVSQVLKVE
ncbi:hypothetical protein [Chenggangzhangella methanolivorans]|uniref:Flp pilus assembly protein TadG n=2 Tax=Chenggangzhangella methanolivorans TaxID=1437009 RepID=A0A9E6UMP9_9HYPH|nr:hypothetical protein [Chenggangzhangella methanolivorans]QZN99403.1 hypothetical protein K6K41_22050 [Chenggangzhangella methanolivorans]